MTKQGRDNKSPPIRLELKGRIPEAVSRIFEAFIGLLCDAIEYLRLRIRIANKRLRESTKREEGKESYGNSPPR